MAVVLPTGHGGRTALNQDRTAAAKAWAFETLQSEDWAIEPIGSDASARCYYRLVGPAQTWILMDAPPSLEPIDAFIDVQARLADAQLNVPRIEAYDRVNGFMLLSDLGRLPYLEALDSDRASGLMAAAEAALLTMQTKVSTAQLRPYDAAKLLSELDLFTDWFLKHHWRVEPTAQELDQWDTLCSVLIRSALDQAQVFCHRDYMPRNLMVSDPNPGILDFQDAVVGPVAYDLISLYMDAFFSWPRADVDHRLEAYRQSGLAAGLPLPDTPEAWLHICDLMSVQRHLKVIGIFARIAYRDGKPKYLEDTPRFFAYLAHTSARQPELFLLDELLMAWKARRQVAH